MTFNAGSLRDFTLNDQSSSATSINIGGTHDTALASIPAAGNFGFGTQTPAAKIHVVGDALLEPISTPSVPATGWKLFVALGGNLCAIAPTGTIVTLGTP